MASRIGLFLIAVPYVRTEELLPLSATNIDLAYKCEQILVSVHSTQKWEQNDKLSCGMRLIRSARSGSVLLQGAVADYRGLLLRQTKEEACNRSWSGRKPHLEATKN